MVESLPEILTLLVVAIAALAEWLHWQRVRRIRHLAFGPTASPAMWTMAAPVIRTLSVGAVCWGLASLLFVVAARVHDQGQLAEGDFQHLVLVVDVSPSMTLIDSGPDGKRQRRQRVSDVVESVFSRIPMYKFKISFIAVYTDAKPILEDSMDHEVVRHILERMPMWHAFKPGETRLMSGIELAAKMAKSWNPGSAHIILLTDGDTVPATGMPKLPASVASFVVVGVGDPNAGKFIDGHLSRQDVNTLRQVANRLGGEYHNGNEKHVPSQAVSKLIEPGKNKKLEDWTRREWALLAIVAGSACLAAIPILLHYLGTQYLAGTPFRPQINKAEQEAAAV
ncbi:MAG: VWA domain-containing protein [Pirellulaceae bacterium]